MDNSIMFNSIRGYLKSLFQSANDEAEPSQDTDVESVAPRTKTITNPCKTCYGKGAMPRTGRRCPECAGIGSISKTEYLPEPPKKTEIDDEKIYYRSPSEFTEDREEFDEESEMRAIQADMEYESECQRQHIIDRELEDDGTPK